MDKTVAFVEFLTDWQNISYEQVETASEIQVFNVIGTIIQLVKNGYMSSEAVYRFLTCLSLDDEDKEKMKKVLDNAHESANIIN
jgi:hypothetical protein